MKTFRLFTIASTFATLAFTGCSLQQTAPATVQGTALHGTVHGGQQPITGASVQLYAAGSTGYGSAYSYTAGTSLLGMHTVTTDSNGYFNISNDYTCPSAATPVYIVAIGGNPGLPNNATNPQIALMTALGPCGNLTSSTNVQISELTTVASVWALSRFMTGIANVGTSSTNATGLANAFASVNKLVDTSAGVAPGPALPANATAPVSKLNTLANILAACVNTSGGTAGTVTTCGTLLTDTTVNGVAPTDTIGAALNLAQHPNLQTAALTNLSLPTAPFQPSLSVPPSDYSLVVSYSGNGLSAPKGVAVDNSGNVWIANSGGNSVTELANSGSPLSGSTGYTIGSLNAPSGIAIDTAGNAWISNTNGNTVTKISSSGTAATSFSGGGLSAPAGVAIDVGGNVWIANGTSSNLTQISPSGTVTSYTGAGATSSTALAINPN